MWWSEEPGDVLPVRLAESRDTNVSGLRRREGRSSLDLGIGVVSAIERRSDVQEKLQTTDHTERHRRLP
jgi:hypothetical protein